MWRKIDLPAPGHRIKVQWIKKAVGKSWLEFWKNKTHKFLSFFDDRVSLSTYIKEEVITTQRHEHTCNGTGGCCKESYNGEMRKKMERKYFQGEIKQVLLVPLSPSKLYCFRLSINRLQLIIFIIEN
ncbi:unnamed protein product [Allacma fusca]|uniref:Uncharacterized protein n=1 Tax=Allacma fusca TaxID=39272 RepID=A0A8J2KV34_9HEXA|nr:unnamed protein product [Allacma fusca]